ncbi:MAG: hypothetical protein WC783_03410 [Candidatus Paceibacterota bacterium]|jgi:hypothetical protein
MNDKKQKIVKIIIKIFSVFEWSFLLISSGLFLKLNNDQLYNVESWIIWCLFFAVLFSSAKNLFSTIK